MNSLKINVFLKKYSWVIFYYLVSLSLIFRLLEDLSLNRQWIHQGLTYPWRHYDFFPLYSVNILYCEFFFILLGALGILSPRFRRTGALIASLGMLMGLTQLFQNQKLLITIVTLTIFMAPPEVNKQGKTFLKWQVILIYFFSGISKLDHFWNGDVLNFISTDTSHYGLIAEMFWPMLDPSFIGLLSKLIVITELLLPIVLLLFPLTGQIIAFALHLSFSLLMPGVGAFSLIMIALLVLYSE